MLNLLHTYCADDPVTNKAVIAGFYEILTALLPKYV
jgi:hypothetical protein